MLSVGTTLLFLWGAMLSKHNDACRVRLRVMRQTEAYRQSGLGRQ